MRKCIVLLAIIVLSGCATMGAKTGPAKDFQDAAVFAKEKKYNEALANYKKILREAPDTELAADARFGVALIHAIPDNPQKDYAQAIHEFEEFLKQYPHDKRTTDARTWVLVLRNVLDLKKENELLNKNIEELKRLDIRHEERRRK